MNKYVSLILLLLLTTTLSACSLLSKAKNTKSPNDLSTPAPLGEEQQTDQRIDLP